MRLVRGNHHGWSSGPTISWYLPQALINLRQTSLLAWYTNFIKLSYDKDGAESDQKTMHLDLVVHFLAMNRFSLEMKKFSAFAKTSGGRLTQSADSLLDEARKWSANRAGNAQDFISKLVEFNVSARNVHAELLAVDNIR